MRRAAGVAARLASDAPRPQMRRAAGVAARLGCISLPEATGATSLASYGPRQDAAARFRWQARLGDKVGLLVLGGTRRRASLHFLNVVGPT